MITAVLAGVILFSLFVGRLEPFWLAAVCLIAAALFLMAKQHRHDGVLEMDVYARRSQLCRENAGVKAAGSAVLLILCISARSPLPPVCLFVYMSVVTVMVGGIRLRDYFSLMQVPVVFLLLSNLTLLWDYYETFPQDTMFYLPLFNGWLAITADAQSLGLLVLSRALGAVSCLYFLSLSTPVPELLEVLRRIHLPAVMLELAVLIYRYIFILLAVSREMRDAAASRLGYYSLKTSLYTTGLVYGGLLGNSFRRAGACFDAMESRCYAGQFVFFMQEKRVSKRIVCILAIPLAGLAAGLLLGY